MRPRGPHRQRMAPDELHARREALGYTGEQLAAALDVTMRTIRKWESGSSPVPYAIDNKLAALEGATQAAIAALVATLETLPPTRRSITIVQEGAIPPAGITPPPGAGARWWRAIALAAARQTGATIAHRHGGGAGLPLTRA
ncbi:MULTISPECIES: helix-turn-helix domain-containing protein [Actinomyces]|nr:MULTISPECIES: helix-turn-helix transcriptional regulator [Actinomyces]